jgi:hypothetical protein
MYIWMCFFSGFEKKRKVFPKIPVFRHIKAAYFTLRKPSLLITKRTSLASPPYIQLTEQKVPLSPELK